MRASGSVRVDPNTLPLRWLFLDLNSYFASVEQAAHPELRGKPVAVVPTLGDGATIIAASYEAKAFGVKTLTKVGDAKVMCPGIILVHGDHTLYTYYHDKVIEACERVLPVDKVCSIDEMRFGLLGYETTPAGAREVALELKKSIAEHAHECLKCSIGVSTNAYLAKVGTELQKPDGLVIITAAELPGRLYGLKLRDWPGINRKMEARLQGCGIFSTEDLMAAPISLLERAFGHVMAERWWHLMRGYDIDFQARSNQSLGHSHVLAPELRNDKDGRAIMARLVYKACMRLRRSGLWTEFASFYVKDEVGWQASVGLPPTQDALTVLERLEPLWKGQKFGRVIQIGVTFGKLKEAEQVTPSLFDGETKPRARLGHAMDSLNMKFGKNTVYVGSLSKAKDHAGEKIAFAKTSLLSEGKDDNVYINTWTGEKVVSEPRRSVKSKKAQISRDK